MEQGEVIQEKNYFECNMDNKEVREFPGGPVVGIMSFSAEDLSSIPGQEARTSKAKQKKR